MPVLSTETKNSKSVTCNHGTDGGDLCREREHARLKWREENRADFQSVRLLTTACCAASNYYICLCFRSICFIRIQKISQIV